MNMNSITSMNQTDLFRTLTGKDPVKSAKVVIRETMAKNDQAEKTETAEKPANRDTLELTNVNDRKVSDINEDTFEHLMEYDPLLDFQIACGMTKEQLATHFGGMAKRLDEAYAQGKFTEDEYNSLNEELLEYYDRSITRCERRAATDEVVKENMRARSQGLNEEMTEMPKMTDSKTMVEEILESMKNSRKSGDVVTDVTEAKVMLEMLKAMEKSDGKNKADKTRIEEAAERMRKQVDDFVSKYCRTDRTLMVKMLETVRKGGMLQGGNDKTFGGSRHETWFTDGYVPKPYY